MVLPEKLASYFEKSKADYDQTCSKIEQLTLASFMERGFYQSGIRKLRKFYASKLSKVISSFKRYGDDLVSAEDTMSGINIRLNVMSGKDDDELCSEAASLKLHMVPLPEMPGSAAVKSKEPALSSASGYTEEASDSGNRASKRLLFYYDQIPVGEIENTVKDVCSLWRKE